MVDPHEYVIGLLEDRGPIPASNKAEKLAYRYLDSGHIDSISLIHFIAAIEDEFDIELTPEDTQSDEFRFVGGLGSLISARISGNGIRREI